MAWVSWHVRADMSPRGTQHDEHQRGSLRAPRRRRRRRRDGGRRASRSGWQRRPTPRSRSAAAPSTPPATTSTATSPSTSSPTRTATAPSSSSSTTSCRVTPRAAVRPRPRGRHLQARVLPELGRSEFLSEYYRDKADLATADFITVAGAAQILAAVDHRRHPHRHRHGHHDRRPRGPRRARVQAYDADDGSLTSGATPPTPRCLPHRRPARPSSCASAAPTPSPATRWPPSTTTTRPTLASRRRRRPDRPAPTSAS